MPKLTSQVRIFPEERFLYPDIHFYKNATGGYQCLIGDFHVAIYNGCIIGVFINGVVYPACDGNLQMVKIRILGNRKFSINERQFRELIRLNGPNYYIHAARCKHK